MTRPVTAIAVRDLVIEPVQLGPDSALHAFVPGSSFQHALRVRLPKAPGTALDVYRDVASCVPGWFDALMRVRNLGMRLLGMKDLGSLRAVDVSMPVAPGQRLGIFTVLEIGDETLVLGDSDRHLEVRLSLQLRRSGSGWSLENATVVRLHNGIGRIYMLPVAPVHRWIMPLLLRRYVRRLAATV